MAVVRNVYDYAPQANRQLQEGDILFKIDGKRVFVLDEIGRYMNSDKNMTFEVLRPTVNEQGNVIYEQVVLQGLTKQDYASVVLSKVDGEYKSADGKATLAVGNTIYKINGVSLSETGAFSALYGQLSGPCELSIICNDGEIRQFVVDSNLFAENKLVAKEQAYNGIGMSIQYAAHKFDFGEALARTFPYCGEVGLLVLRTLGGLITGVVGVDQVGGPITTISMTSQVVATGFPNVLRLIVLISVNLAVFNLLPVPALDGCQMVFVLIEWIARKPINRKIQGYINGIGLIVLIVLMVLIDILKL